MGNCRPISPRIRGKNTSKNLLTKYTNNLFLLALKLSTRKANFMKEKGPNIWNANIWGLKKAPKNKKCFHYL